MTLNRNFTALIIEDEKPSQKYLTDLLASCFPSVKLVSVEDTVQPAIDAIFKYDPDILFLDIEIKSGSGFDVLKQVGDRNFQVLFTTAYNQFAIDAFQYNAVDYLLKPLERIKVIHAIERCIRKVEMQQSNQEVIRLLQYLRQPVRQQRLPINTTHGIDFINPEEIVFIEADGNYSRLKLTSGKQMLVTKKIKEMEQMLPEPGFIRTHHSYLVNTGFIKKYYKGRGGYILLDDDSSIPVSSAQKENFIKLFHNRL